RLGGGVGGRVAGGGGGDGGGDEKVGGEYGAGGRGRADGNDLHLAVARAHAAPAADLPALHLQVVLDHDGVARGGKQIDVVERGNRLTGETVQHDPQALLLDRPELGARGVEDPLGHFEPPDLVLPDRIAPLGAAQEEHERIPRGGQALGVAPQRLGRQLRRERNE